MIDPILPPVPERPSAPKLSAKRSHFATAVDLQRGLFRFVCDGQPLMTLTSYGYPRRCPLCRERNPIGNTKPNGNRDANAQR
jgi:hypothetical protein